MQIDWWTLALQGINFLILVWLLQRFLFKPVKQVLERRKELAQKAFEEAAAAKAEAQAAGESYETRRAELESERQALLKEAHDSLQAERRKLLEASKKEAEAYEEATRAALEEERRQALKSLRGEIAETAVTLAAALLDKSAAQPSYALVLEALLEKLKSLPGEERARLQKDLEGEEARLQVATASGLSPKEEERWRAGLEAALEGSGAKMAFCEDPSLLGGAELRFPHSVIKFNWADQLRAAEEELSADETAQ